MQRQQVVPSPGVDLLDGCRRFARCRWSPASADLGRFTPEGGSRTGWSGWSSSAEVAGRTSCAACGSGARSWALLGHRRSSTDWSPRVDPRGCAARLRSTTLVRFDRREGTCSRRLGRGRLAAETATACRPRSRRRSMPEPMPPEEWPARIERRGGGPRHEFPPRPDVVQVREPERRERTHGSAGYAGHAPADAPSTPSPNLLRPEQTRPPRWRRPPGQKDDLGEPTGP